MKRSILTDGRGVPIGIVIAPADWHDTTLLLETIRKPCRFEDQNQLKAILNIFIWTKVTMQIGLELFCRYLESLLIFPLVGHGEVKSRWRKDLAQGKPRRWVVERSHSWLNRYRSLLIRWEKKPEYYRALLHLAAGILCFKKSGLGE